MGTFLFLAVLAPLTQDSPQDRGSREFLLDRFIVRVLDIPYRLIRDPEEWERLVREGDVQGAVPKVDFRKNAVLVVRYERISADGHVRVPKLHLRKERGEVLAQLVLTRLPLPVRPPGAAPGVYVDLVPAQTRRAEFVDIEQRRAEVKVPLPK